MIEIYILNLTILFGIYALSAVAFNFSFGYTGILNLAHMAFFGIGAYAAAMIALNNFPFYLAFIAGALFPTIFALLLSLVSKKLKGDYFALAALVFAIISYSVVLNTVELTGGPHGMRDIPRPNMLGIDFSNDFAYMGLVAVISTLGIFFIYRLVKSPFGRVCIAIRDNEQLAESLGKNTFKVKLIVLLISSILTGAAGSLFAFYVNFVDPTVFDILGILMILSMVVLGGLASIKGTLVGTFLVLIIPEILRFLNFSSADIGTFRLISYSLILLVILNYKSGGLYGKISVE